MAGMSLFRKEVTEARRGEWLGSIIVATPVSRWFFSLLAMALAGAILLFLLFGHYTRHETVVGRLVLGVDQRNIVVPSAGSPLQAKLLVPSGVVGFIDLGSRVVLRFEAFPYQEYGLQYGYVTDISHSALLPAEMTALTGKEAPAPLYGVEVTLDRPFVVAHGRKAPLKPGMALSADILMPRQRIIEWMFGPLHDLGHGFSGEASHG